MDKKKEEGMLMDKKKTGNLIKEARMKKAYTQSELGDLLGVSNKAVSRWENGESFPDVGILENLASILDVRIQDIITGDVGKNDESVVADVVRVARMQQKEKQRDLIRNSLVLFVLLCCTILGYASLRDKTILFSNDSILIYVIFMVLSFGMTVAGYASQVESKKIDNSRLCKCMKAVSVISLAWSVFVTWGVFVMVINGYIPFGIEPLSLGPFVNWQLVGLFLVNVVILGIGLFRYEKKDEAIHWGYLVSIATIYMTVLYGDMLHRMSTVHNAITILAARTFIVLVFVLVSLVITNRYKVNSKQE